MVGNKSVRILEWRMMPLLLGFSIGWYIIEAELSLSTQRIMGPNSLRGEGALLGSGAAKRLTGGWKGTYTTSVPFHWLSLRSFLPRFLCSVCYFASFTFPPAFFPPLAIFLASIYMVRLHLSHAFWKFKAFIDSVDSLWTLRTNRVESTDPDADISSQLNVPSLLQTGDISGQLK